MADRPSAEELAGGRSIEERADDGDEQLEAFPQGVLDGDKSVSLKTLVKPGQKTEVTVALSRAEVPMRGGLPDPSKSIRLAVTGVVAKYEPVPQREDDSNPDKVTSWKVRAHLRAAFVEQLGVGPSGEILLAYRELLAAEPSAAAALLEQMQTATADALGAPA